MITKKDLDEAIKECQGVRSPNASTCIKLAAFYTIKREMYPDRKEEPGYSQDAPDVVSYDSGTEFADLINGQQVTRVLEVFDELMGSLQIVEPRLYAAVLRKFSE